MLNQAFVSVYWNTSSCVPEDRAQTFRLRLASFFGGNETPLDSGGPESAGHASEHRETTPEGWSTFTGAMFWLHC